MDLEFSGEMRFWKAPPEERGHVVPVKNPVRKAEGI
jgi:hypothetical protein